MQVHEHIDRFHDGVRAADGAKRDIPAGDSLGHGDHVRLDIQVLGAEHFSGATKSADNFVNYHENAIFVADFPNNRPVLWRRKISAESLHDRLSDKHGKKLRALELDDALNIPGAGHVTVRVSEVVLTAVTIRRLHEHRTRG